MFINSMEIGLHFQKSNSVDDKISERFHFTRKHDGKSTLHHTVDDNKHTHKGQQKLGFKQNSKFYSLIKFIQLPKTQDKKI